MSYPLRRLAVLERADFRCERCGQSASHRDPAKSGLGLAIHHIKGRRVPDAEELHNLRALCRPCHTIEDRRSCPECGRVLTPGALESHRRKHLRERLGIPTKQESGEYISMALGLRGRWVPTVAQLEKAGEELPRIEERLRRLEGNRE